MQLFPDDNKPQQNTNPVYVLGVFTVYHKNHATQRNVSA